MSVPAPFFVDWTPTRITSVRYTSTLGPSHPVGTIQRRVCGSRCLIGVSLFLLTNAADGFLGLDQFAGQGAWHLSGLGQPVLMLSFWQWTLLACLTLALVKLAEKTSGILTERGQGRAARMRLLVTCVALALGGLARSLIHPG